MQISFDFELEAAFSSSLEPEPEEPCGQTCHSPFVESKLHGGLNRHPWQPHLREEVDGEQSIWIVRYYSLRHMSVHF